MIGRWQLPAYSPVTLPMLSAGRQSAETVERWLARTLGVEDAILVDSGTSALALAIGMHCRSPGDRVALPAYGCYDLATAATAAGASAVLYDVDPETLGPDWDSLARVLAEGVTVVVVAHLFGFPVDWDHLTALTRPHGVPVIDDAAQGVGAEWGGRPVGTLGVHGVLSFGRGKGRTVGGGGALLFGDSAGTDQADELRGRLPPGADAISSTARLLAQWAWGRPALYGLLAALPFLGLGRTVFRTPHPPARMVPRLAGRLAPVWELAEAETVRRRQNARRLAPAVAEGAAIRGVRCPQQATPGFLRLPVRCQDRERIHRARRLGIVGGYPLPLSRLPGFGQPASLGGESYAGAVELAETLCTIPCHGRLSDADLRRLERWCAGW